MFIGFKHLHSFTAYLTLIFLVIAVLYSFYALSKRLAFTKTSKSIILLGLIGAHLQFVFGLVLYFVSPMGVSNFSGEMMKNSVARLYGLEHPLMMLLAIILITVGYSKAKRTAEAQGKFKKIAIFYSLGLVFVLSRIPWQAWLG